MISNKERADQAMNSAEMTLAVEDAIYQHDGWGLLARDITIPGLGTVTYEPAVSHSQRSPEGAYYDEWSQGSTETVWMIYQLLTYDGETFFFKKEGTADSYGAISWDGKFREVLRKEKSVTVYEWSDK